MSTLSVHRHALTAIGKGLSYSIISADALAEKVRRTYVELRENDTASSESVLRRTSKQKVGCVEVPAEIFFPPLIEAPKTISCLAVIPDHRRVSVAHRQVGTC